MAAEKALALVLRTTDWSETSRIATLWTREFGKVRVLAKGGRRLRSNFDLALDLLTLCSIVFLRKSSGGLELLTEAQSQERFPRLRDDLAALYAAYYVAELLSDWTEEYDPHALLFDEALATLRDLGAARDEAEKRTPRVETGPRVMRFEAVLLRELGYGPALEACGGCGARVQGRDLAFSAAAGGVLCRHCQPGHPDRRPLSASAWQAMQALAAAEDWHRPWDAATRAEVRQVLGHYLTWLRGRRPRLLPYLGS